MTLLPRTLLRVTLLAAVGMAMPLRAAELFYMDHDTLTARYVGAVGPLVLSGDIVPGDYDRLLTRIAQDEPRFLEQNTLILASERGDVAEALRIGRLVRALLTQVVVDPLAGRCGGACFLIYAAAGQRATDGHGLLGVQQAPAVEAALTESGVSPALLAEFARHTTETYWLTDADERSLGSRSPGFVQYLKARCAWDDAVEREVFSGKRPAADARPLLDCRARVTRSDARKALAGALAERAARR
jgi:hypothetical protein